MYPTTLLQYTHTHTNTQTDTHACDLHKDTLGLMKSSLVTKVQHEANLAGVFTLEALPRALPVAIGLAFMAVAGKRVK